jgi:hypothetical protein
MNTSFSLNGTLPINDYDNIIVHKNSLLVLDIDDTILIYDELGKKWWQQELNKFYNIYNDHAIAEQRVMEEWERLIRIYKPKHINKEKYEALVKRVEKSNSHIIFITKRNEHNKTITEKDLLNNDIIVDFDTQLFHSNNKGLTLKKYLSNNKYNFDNIIMVDDNEQNLYDIIVYANINPNTLSLYHFLPIQ